MENRLERLPVVMARAALPRSTLYQLVKAGRFPKPVAIGERAVAWRSSDVDDWIAQRTEKPA